MDPPATDPEREEAATGTFIDRFLAMNSTSLTTALRLAEVYEQRLTVLQIHEISSPGSWHRWPSGIAANWEVKTEPFSGFWKWGNPM